MCAYFIVYLSGPFCSSERCAKWTTLLYRYSGCRGDSRPAMLERDPTLPLFSLLRSLRSAQSEICLTQRGVVPVQAHKNVLPKRQTPPNKGLSGRNRFSADGPRNIIIVQHQVRMAPGKKSAIQMH